MKNSQCRIEWSEMLSMLNPQIDAEHKHIIELVNELNDAIASPRRDKADIVRIMGLILEDSVAHFGHEENLFIVKGYPEVFVHSQSHAALVSTLEQSLKEIQNTEFSSQWLEIGLTIRDQFVGHVVNEDIRYVEYLRTKQS